MHAARLLDHDLFLEVGGEPADDAEVELAPLAKPRRDERLAQRLELRELGGGDSRRGRERADAVRELHARPNRGLEARQRVSAEAERGRALREFLRRHLVAPVEQLECGRDRLLRDAERTHEARRRDAVADLHAHVRGPEPEPRERAHGDADHLRIDRGALDAEQVDVPLEELAEPAALWALGAKEARHREPLDRHGQLRRASRRHARERRRELRPKRVVVAAARPAEAEQLADDPLAALRGVQLEVLEGRAVDLVEAERNARLAPRRLDAPPHRHLGGVEVAGALRCLELHVRTSSA